MEQITIKELPYPVDAQVDFIDRGVLVTKWNWDFEECLAFQKEAQRFVQNNRHQKVFIFCNHPHCFTLGRGNERGRDDLVEFDPVLEKQLEFKVHRIHRGGGITFHYPGQWIAYPIIAINQNYTLDDHMCWLLKNVRNVLTDHFDIPNVITANKLMGVWKDKKKLASIGVGVNRFVTEHGLALNLKFDEKMFNELKKINPCGMDFQTYQCVDQFISNSKPLEVFHQAFVTKTQLI